MNGTDAIPQKTSSSDLVGTWIADKYEIRQVLGRGGMGQVYEAVQHPLGRRVAIKMLHARKTDPSLRKDLRMRFLREAAAYARLVHANTVTMFDYGALEDENETLFMVMEFVRGQTLKQLLAEQGALDARRSLGIAYQVALSLREAHRMGIVHRDLKPSNIMVELHSRRPDTVKVLDFGLAKILDTETSGSLSFDEFQQLAKSSQGATQHGMMIGSPGYMAPEQIEGEATDKRSDLYSLGAILFEMLTGSQPFQGLNAIETMMMHLNADVPTFFETNPHIIVPDELESLVHRCMEKSPSSRFSSADALMDAIRSAVPAGGLGELLTEEVPAPPGLPAESQPRVATRTPALLIALTVAAALIAAFLLA